jgi:hypothetical protein
MSLKKKTEKELLQICIGNSGAYITNGHPTTSFATTYSTRFVEAAAELYQRFSKTTNRRSATIKLYVAMRDAKIPACREGTMTFNKVEYLVKRRVIPHLYG